MTVTLRKSMGATAIVASVYWVSAVTADPLRLTGDALSQTSSPVGLVVLHGEDRAHPYVDAEAVVWFGARGPPDVTGDVLTLTVRVHDSRGRAEIRVGRFVYTAGGIRPLHVDGVRVLVRPYPHTSLETFAGVPVVPRFGNRAFDLAVGGRAGQSVGTWLTVGVAYVVRRSEGQLLDQEVGPDVAFAPTKWFDGVAHASFDLIHRGPTEAVTSLGFQTTDFRVELFAVERSPGRMLPATSLFSVLGDIPSTTSGVTIRYRAAPRLELMGSGATIDTGGDLGAYGLGRASLALADDGPGTLGLEVRRQYVGTTGWFGARAISIVPLSNRLRASCELEIVRPDVPTGANRVWPWTLLATTYRLSTSWDVAAAAELSEGRTARAERLAMLRVSYAFEGRR